MTTETKRYPFAQTAQAMISAMSPNDLFRSINTARFLNEVYGDYNTAVEAKEAPKLVSLIDLQCTQFNKTGGTDADQVVKHLRSIRDAIKDQIDGDGSNLGEQAGAVGKTAGGGEHATQ